MVTKVATNLINLSFSKRLVNFLAGRNKKVNILKHKKMRERENEKKSLEKEYSERKKNLQNYVFSIYNGKCVKTKKSKKDSFQTC